MTGLDASMWRALSVFRALTLAYAVIVSVVDFGDTTGSRAALVAVLAVMAGWTVAVTVLTSRPRWRRWWLLAADMAVVCGATVATRLAEDPAAVATGEPTVPLLWVATAPLAWAIHLGTAGGLAGAVLGVAAGFAGGQSLSFDTVQNAVLFVTAAGAVGYLSGLTRRARETLAEGVRLRAATAERERLSREIHDGVLQVLALVQRRGAAVGGEAGEIGRLAGEQGAALRSLMTSPPPPPVPVSPGGAGADIVDLAPLLAALTRSTAGRRLRVSLSAPAGRVPLPGRTARELVAAVTAALDNVECHAGPDCRAWVLVEDTGDAVLVTVRDDGAGIPAGRLADAAAAGRLGVAQSIVGRLHDLGGTATVTSVPGEGTEVELRVLR